MEVREVRNIMVTAMTQPQGWSINSVVKKLEEALPEDVHGNLRNIARSETQSIKNVSRVLEYEDRDPEGEFKYEWIGPAQPGRTTEVCTAIKKRTKGGVSLKELNKIINEESRKGGFEPRPYLPHYQCRHTPRRVVL